MLNRHKMHRLMAKMRQYQQKHFTDHRGRTDWKKIAIITLLGAVSLVVLGFLILATAIAVLSIGLPDVHDLDNLSVAQSTTIYDREGNILYVKFGAENRNYVKLNQISPNLQHAIIAIEDDEFYKHPGFDMFGLVRAALKDISGGKQQGGSTITQQYIKLTFLSSEKSLTRKIKELILAVRLEEAYDKDTILEKYLNKISYGNNAYGIEKAAQTYFKKTARDLTLAESAILAAVPNNPTFFNPYGAGRISKLSDGVTAEILNKRNVNTAGDLRANEYRFGLIGQTIDLGNGKSFYLKGRTDDVLRRMREVGYITERQEDEALDEVKQLKFEKSPESMKAPHFVQNLVLQPLEAKYGKELVEQGGLKIYTTIDPKLQENAEKAITDRSESYQKKYNVKNAALVSMNPQNGQILAYVGSRNYFDKEIDGQTNIPLSYRQHGSTFKPIVYAAAFLNRYSPSSVVFDAPTPFGGDYPKNFDGKFQGPITLRKALAGSRNIPAIKSYYLAGEQQAIIPFAKKLGVKFLDDTKDDYGYPMVLGSAETTLLSMTNAFGTFANQGKHCEPVTILKIENAQGQTLEEYNPETVCEEALDPQIAFLITSVLSDRSVNVGPNLNIEGQINAAKTGTSNRKNGSQYLPHDLLTLGYTTQLVTGVWAGNNDDTKDGPLSYSADGYNVAAPIFKDFMESSLKGRPAEEFPIPEGIKQLAVSKYSGKLVTDLTPLDQQVTDFFASFAAPTEVDDSYTGSPDFTAFERLDSAPCSDGQQQNRFQAVLHDIDPTHEVWENAAQEWLKENNAASANLSATVQCKPSEAGLTPIIKITNLKDGDLVSAPGQSVSLDISSANPTKQALFYFDGGLQYTQDLAPFTGNIRVPKVANRNDHTLTVKVYDLQGNIGETTIKLYTKVPETSATTITTPPAIPVVSTPTI